MLLGCGVSSNTPDWGEAIFTTVLSAYREDYPVLTKAGLYPDGMTYAEKLAVDEAIFYNTNRNASSNSQEFLDGVIANLLMYSNGVYPPPQYATSTVAVSSPDQVMIGSKTILAKMDKSQASGPSGNWWSELTGGLFGSTPEPPVVEQLPGGGTQTTIDQGDEVVIETVVPDATSPTGKKITTQVVKKPLMKTQNGKLLVLAGIGVGVYLLWKKVK